MMLIRLTYFSRSRVNLRAGCRDSGIDEILAASTANNLRDDITAVLICDRCWFAQVLEGTESRVSITFERILRDPRHCDVTLVTMQAEAARRYPDFAMLGVVRSEDNGDLFRHYGEDESFDPRQMRADRLCDLIEEVVRRHTTGGPPWMTRSNTNAA